ncbi:MAG: prepilin-type N-terminal cleavage/methylation domain-containing protein, partial [FCB group bacterium]|nr:prepilin-type N-terminal cleavage/methylation domain-containing protein [FCB group bacterium]
MGLFKTRRSRAGFSLIELLVVIAIIGILFGMYLSTLHKAIGKAKKVAVTEGMRQEQLGRMADGANSANKSSGPANREECRQAFRHKEQTSEGEILVTEVRYVVRSDAEFRAYWHTMINYDNPDEPQYAGDSLRAIDEDGNEFSLHPIDANGWSAMNVGGKTFPLMWEFFSTRVADTTTTGLGATVLYNDGHVDYVRY